MVNFSLMGGLNSLTGGCSVFCPPPPLAPPLRGSVRVRASRVRNLVSINCMVCLENVGGRFLPTAYFVLLFLYRCKNNYCYSEDEVCDFTDNCGDNTDESTCSNVRCNFERGLCNWHNVNEEDDFDWTRHKGSTSSFGTGPSHDHTTGQTTGKKCVFIYWITLVRATPHRSSVTTGGNRSTRRKPAMFGRVKLDNTLLACDQGNFNQITA